MTEATFHVVYETLARNGKPRWWAEIMGTTFAMIGYGNTPGEAVDDLMKKMEAMKEQVQA